MIYKEFEYVVAAIGILIAFYIVFGVAIFSIDQNALDNSRVICGNTIYDSCYITKHRRGNAHIRCSNEKEAHLVNGCFTTNIIQAEEISYVSDSTKEKANIYWNLFTAKQVKEAK